MRFDVALSNNATGVDHGSEELVRRDLYPDPVVGGKVGGAVARVEPEGHGLVVLLHVGFVAGWTDGLQVRGAGGHGVVRHVYAHYVLGLRRRRRRVRRGPRSRVRSRRRPLYAQTTDPRADNAKIHHSIKIQYTYLRADFSMVR